MNSMMNLFYMFVGEEVSKAYPIIRIAILILIVMCSLFLTIVVLGQEGNSSGLGAIGGGAETFLGKNKAKTMEGKMKKLTVYVAIALAVFCIAFAIVSLFPF